MPVHAGLSICSAYSLMSSLFCVLPFHTNCVQHLIVFTFLYINQEIEALSLQEYDSATAQIEKIRAAEESASGAAMLGELRHTIADAMTNAPMMLRRSSMHSVTSTPNTSTASASAAAQAVAASVNSASAGATNSAASAHLRQQPPHGGNVATWAQHHPAASPFGTSRALSSNNDDNL